MLKYKSHSRAQKTLLVAADRL